MADVAHKCVAENESSTKSLHYRHVAAAVVANVDYKPFRRREIVENVVKVAVANRA